MHDFFLCPPHLSREDLLISTGGENALQDGDDREARVNAVCCSWGGKCKGRQQEAQALTLEPSLWNEMYSAAYELRVRSQLWRDLDGT